MKIFLQRDLQLGRSGGPHTVLLWLVCGSPGWHVLMGVRVPRHRYLIARLWVGSTGRGLRQVHTEISTPMLHDGAWNPWP